MLEVILLFGRAYLATIGGKTNQLITCPWPNLIEEAILMKQEIMNYKATTVAPEINANLRWQMSRFQTSGKVFVTCHGLKEDLNTEWYGAPAFINGKPWCLRAATKTLTDDGLPIKYLSAYIYCLSDMSFDFVKIKFAFELVPDKYSSNKPYFSHECLKTFDKDTGKKWGYSKFRKMSSVLQDYHDEETDECVIIGHVTDITGD